MSSTTDRLRIDVARAFAPLLKAARYKGAYGGRGGAKSHFFAEQLLAQCYSTPKRAVCIREVQNSIRDSVRQLLVDKIRALDLGGFFEPMEAEIRGGNGSLIIFKGMQSYNAETIKSLEAYDIAWVEEAQTLSAKSLELLRPTIRREGSEIWFSWNPRHRTDPVDVFFRKHPHPDAVAVNVNWRDNPWFPDVLRREMRHDKIADPEAAEHVWEGGYGQLHGAILARLIDAADRTGRVHDGIKAEADVPVEISSDIGLRDTAAWWYWQRRIGGYSLLDYDADSGIYADDWIERIKARIVERGWTLGRVWLPHDARHRAFQSRHSALEQFLAGFGADKCAIVPQTSILNRINAARTLIPRCEFHASRCEAGLDGLRAWSYEWNPELQVFAKEPLHDWASHPADAFSYGCQIMLERAPPQIAEDNPLVGIEGLTFAKLKESRRPPAHRRI